MNAAPGDTILAQVTDYWPQVVPIIAFYHVGVPPDWLKPPTWTYNRPCREQPISQYKHTTMVKQAYMFDFL